MGGEFNQIGFCATRASSRRPRSVETEWLGSLNCDLSLRIRNRIQYVTLSRREFFYVICEGRTEYQPMYEVMAHWGTSGQDEVLQRRFAPPQDDMLASVSVTFTSEALGASSSRALPPLLELQPCQSKWVLSWHPALKYVLIMRIR